MKEKLKKNILELTREYYREVHAVQLAIKARYLSPIAFCVILFGWVFVQA